MLKLIEYLIRTIFMEKACRKPAVKSSSMRLFNLVISPKQPAHLWDFQKKIFFKRDREKVNLIFAFAPSDFLRTKFWKAKMPGTSYQSLWLSIHACKNSFFGLTREKKTTKDWVNRGKKRFSKFLKCFLLVKYEK